MNKLLLLSITILLSLTIANAKTTVCYKKNWQSPSTIETTTLDGGVCEGKYSLQEMKKMRWYILDIKIDSEQNNLSYQYLLTNDQIVNTKVVKNVQIKEKNNLKEKFSLKTIPIKITNITENKTTIDVGNLTIGQSGVVVHVYNDDKKLIISNAQVIESNKTSSIIKFSKFDDLTQEALPNSNRIVQKNDILLLNYLYNASLLIAPNLDTFQTIKSNFIDNNFLHSDIFATKLKQDREPYLTKEYIQNYAISQNLGTIFIVANQYIYILDTKTLKVLTIYQISYDTSKAEMPFYTRVTDIESSNFNIEFLSNKKNLTYDEYYKKLLGLK